MKLLPPTVCPYGNFLPFASILDPQPKGNITAAWSWPSEITTASSYQKTGRIYLRERLLLGIQGQESKGKSWGWAVKPVHTNYLSLEIQFQNITDSKINFKQVLNRSLFRWESPDTTAHCFLLRRPKKILQNRLQCIPSLEIPFKPTLLLQILNTLLVTDHLKILNPHFRYGLAIEKFLHMCKWLKLPHWKTVRM